MSEPLALSVVVFAYDEAENVAGVLEELFTELDARFPEHETIVVDDGSRDETAERAREALGRRAQPGRVLSHGRNRGIGAALKTGVRGARLPWVTFMPADGQIDPRDLARLAEPAERGEATVVLSVYDHRDDGLDRKVLSAGVRALIAAVHGVRLRSDGPYLFRRAVFDPDDLPPDTFFLNFEFPIRVLRAGIPTATVTLRCRPRRAGQSKSTGIRRIAGVARDLVALRVRFLRRSLAGLVAWRQ